MTPDQATELTRNSLWLALQIAGLKRRLNWPIKR
ncbi:MAG: hypothetical protein FD138_4747 [Planctomycetota bacterium]|nr:MAG: hypothetical protein FD138_4747 [Planctomycetota bacterium]